MLRLLPDTVAPARVVGPAAMLTDCLLACLLSPGGTAARAAPGDDHQQAVATLTDVKAAIAELVRADASYATDPKVYHGAAQRAINALVGMRGADHIAGAGSSGDVAGAIGNIDSLLDRAATPVWTHPLRSAEANIRAAIIHLKDAAKAHELMDYAVAASRALDYLEVARGRPDEIGVFGGLEGVLANTELGRHSCRRASAGCLSGAIRCTVLWDARRLRRLGDAAGQRRHARTDPGSRRGER